jgi:hypothetical protein
LETLEVCIGLLGLDKTTLQKPWKVKVNTHLRADKLTIIHLYLSIKNVSQEANYYCLQKWWQCPLLICHWSSNSRWRYW